MDLIRPPSAIGKSTVESIQSGVLYGNASLVEGMVKRLSKELGMKPHIIATGGYAPILAEVCSEFSAVDTNLTLKGLCLAYHQLK